MTFVHRVLPVEPIGTLDQYIESGGGRALDAARGVGADAVIAELEAAGLRGRGGAGFPTARKWQTVRGFRSDALPATVVVNAAEGEPGTFKDRAILRANPYHVLEGALIAAEVVGADQIAVALKASFVSEAAKVKAAIAEIEAVGWAKGIELSVFEGPGEYLYGEETALLEVLDGRPPFPRIAPPFRRGAGRAVGRARVVDSDAETDEDSGLAAEVQMAAEDGEQLAPPTLANNVETLANVPAIVNQGAAWFRSVGTEKSPGTIVCTITGAVRHAGVGEIAMGATLRDAIAEIGGGPVDKHEIVAVLPGVAAALLPAELLDTPLTYEDMAAAGSGLGSAGFIVLDDTSDVVAAVAGVSRFLAVESCGQCTPCKQDGLALWELLTRISRSEAGEDDVARIRDHVATVADGARCYLATQQQVIVQGLLDRFGFAVAAHVEGSAARFEPMVVAELLDVHDGEATVDIRHRDKQPDWTYDEEFSGASPADLLMDHIGGDGSASARSSSDK